MRWPGRRVTVYAYGRPTDMRKGFDGLSALVTQDLARDPEMSKNSLAAVSSNREDRHGSPPGSPSEIRLEPA